MGTTLATLRREIGQDLDECYVGTIISATTLSVTDTSLIDPDSPPSKYDRAWVKCFWSSLDKETRRVRATRGTVKGYDPEAGRLTLAPPFTNVPDTGSEFEIHTGFHPDDMDRLITNGVERCYYEYNLDISAVSGQSLYDLSSYTWLTTPFQVSDIYLVTNVGDVDLEASAPIEWYKLTGNSLYVRSLTTSTGDKLRLVCVRPYGAYLGTEDGTDCPIRWAKAAAMIEVYQWLMRPSPAEDAKRYRESRAEAAVVFDALSAAFRPRPARRVQL